MRIRKLGVVGAGTMGGGIAALAASAGVPVVLLDIPGGGNDRNAAARSGLERAKKASRRHSWMSSAPRDRTGNTEDDLARLAECDLVVEAIIEQLEPKRALVRAPRGDSPEHAIIASNTSGIPIHSSARRPRRRRSGRRFLGMHFFNPPRYLHLLEIIPTPETSQENGRGRAPFQRSRSRQGHRRREGRTRIRRQPARRVRDGARDSPDGEARLDDRRGRRAHGCAHGRSKSATYRTADLSGIDVIAHVTKGLSADDGRRLFALAMGARARRRRDASARRAVPASISVSARRSTRSIGAPASTSRSRNPDTPSSRASANCRSPSVSPRSAIGTSAKARSCESTCCDSLITCCRRRR